MKIYLGTPAEGFTQEELKRGYQYLHMDITCDCGKEQALTNLKPGGRCVRCDKKLIDL